MSFGVAAVVALAVLVAVSAGKGGDHRPAAAAAVEPDTADLPGFVLQAPPVDEGPLRYDTEYPTIPYSTGARTDAVAALVARLNRGDVKLEYRAPRGYLDSCLLYTSPSPRDRQKSRMPSSA